MTPVEQVKPLLEKRLTEVIELVGHDSPEALTFFFDVLTGLRAAEEEQDLIGVFILLSSAAFQGFMFSPPTEAAIDTLLEDAQNVAETFSVTDAVKH